MWHVPHLLHTWVLPWEPTNNAGNNPSTMLYLKKKVFVKQETKNSIDTVREHGNQIDIRSHSLRPACFLKSLL